MVNFLINRPIAVLMSFLALLLTGLVTMTSLPVSLMPDIDIPVVSIRVSSGEMPARELENTVIKPLRNVLKEVNNVEVLKSETRDGTAWVELRFRHGTPVDLASVEVNEKVDKAMNFLPRDMRRPEVIRASAADIPVFYLMVTKKRADIPGITLTGDYNSGISTIGSGNAAGGVSELLDLSNFTSQVVRKRLEQLPEVALVDMSGLHHPEIRLIPRSAYIQSGSFSISQLEQALRENNVDLGNLLIRDGQYQYNIRFNTRLRDADDIENIPVNIGGKVVKLKELVEVNLKPQLAHGSVRFNSENAVSMAVIKQSDARMADMKKELELMVSRFREDYPDLEFSVTRDQTRLLEYSMENLWQSLLVGGLLAFLSMFIFLGERRAPWLIGISIPVSLIISLLLFYLAGLSINIISLSGLVLGVGMMIDNSIIVIDNITQHRQRKYQMSKTTKTADDDQIKGITTKQKTTGTVETTETTGITDLPGGGIPSLPELLNSACTNGTNEVIRPLITSVLTTCAVFIPLIFMRGMAGALFFDQAVAVSIGLVVSLLVAITLLPTLYRLFYKDVNKEFVINQKQPFYYYWYESGLKFVLRRGYFFVAVVLSMLLLAVVFWFWLPVTQFPEVSHDDAVLEIDWNEPVTLDENMARTNALLQDMETEPVYVIEEAGRQQYMLNSTEEAGISESRLFFKVETPEVLEQLIIEIEGRIKRRYPQAEFSFSETENLFNLAFGKPEAPLVARFIHYNPGGENFLTELSSLQQANEREFGERVQSKLITRQIIHLETDPERLLFYGIDHNDLLREIKSAFNTNTVFTINDNNMYIPVSIGNSYRSVFDIIQRVTVKNDDHGQIPLSGLVKVSTGVGLKSIVAGKEGEYFPVMLSADTREFGSLSARIKEISDSHEGFDVQFGGSILSNRDMLNELMLIVVISLLLLYFILAAQFESFVLPLIVLFEVPLNMFGVFLLLKLFGSGINIMSAIGIIVMAGIVINDSILKVDTINKLRDSGYSLLHSIFEGGHRRLKPIIMTSLTTMLALLPFLFQQGMGAELQKPLGLAVIGGMITGTFVSLFFIPLLYYLFKRR